MYRNPRWTIGGVLLVAAIAIAIIAGANRAGATGADDHAAPITGTALERASAAALQHTGAGRVTDSEVGDEDGAYEVEVTFDDGRQVDVHLDETFNVLSQDADVDAPNDQDARNED